MSTIVILPTPLPSGSISLGQLITDPLQSHIASFILSSKPSEHRTNHTKNYLQIILHDDYGHFISSATPDTHAAQDNLLFLTAEQSSHTSLTHPKPTFNSLRKSTTARSFLHTSTLQNQSLYYVTGIQTLKNPSFKRAVFTHANVAEASGTEIRLPIHERRMDSAVGLDNNTNAPNKNEDSEECVFAVELLKVACRVGNASEPHSVEDVDYEWSYHKLDEGEEEVQLAIGLGKKVRAEELRVRGMGEDSGYDDSWSYGSDDEEGLGGF